MRRSIFFKGSVLYTMQTPIYLFAFFPVYSDNSAAVFFLFILTQQRRERTVFSGKNISGKNIGSYIERHSKSKVHPDVFSIFPLTRLIPLSLIKLFTKLFANFFSSNVPDPFSLPTIAYSNFNTIDGCVHNCPSKMAFNSVVSMSNYFIIIIIYYYFILFYNF